MCEILGGTMLAVVSLLCTGLLVPSPLPTPVPVQRMATQPQIVPALSADNAIFPSDGPSVLLAKIFKPEDIVKPELTEEEEAQAKADARVKGVIIVLLSALPSLYAQDKLVWEKERAGIQVFGSKDKKAKKASKKRK